uniref:Ammonia transport outward protein 2 n=1 Tax=Anthurium amnicola TaxID=1678845 RepID=A0A1D1ZDY0_9ARAE
MPGERSSNIYVQEFKPSEKRERNDRLGELRATTSDLKPSTSYKRYYHHPPAPKLANPTPLGLSAFALSVMVISFYNCRAFGIDIPNAAVGVCLFTGGLVQFAAGMWEMRVGNTFGATGFSAFGGFWASYGVIFIPSFNVNQAFVDANGVFQETQYHNALAVYSIAWTIFTFIFTLACIRTSGAVLTAFVLLTIVFLFETIYHFTMVQLFINLAGIIGIVTSMVVWYCFAGVLLTPDLSPISLPLYDLSVKV